MVIERILPVHTNVSLDWETYQQHSDSLGLCSLQLQVRDASPEEIQKAPARIAIPDAFMLVKLVAGIWESRLQALAQDGGVVVVQTGLEVPQEQLSQAVQAIYSKKLSCSSDTVGSFLYIADYLQVMLYATPGWEIDCLLKPILAFLHNCVLPQLPGVVYNLGLTFHHLNIPRENCNLPGEALPVGLCQAARDEVLKQLRYQGDYHLASTVWADNDRAWEHAKEVLLQMDGEQTVELMGHLFACCLSALQVVGLLLDWISVRLQASSLREGTHRAWVNNLAELLRKHTTTLEAKIILTGLNQRAAESFDGFSSLWLDLYRAFTDDLLNEYVGNAGSQRSRAIFSIPLSCMESNSREDFLIDRAPLPEGPGPYGRRLFCLRATHGAAGWGLTLQPRANNCMPGPIYYLRSSDIVVFGCLPRMGEAGAGLYMPRTCGLKGDRDSTDWITHRSGGLLTKWARTLDCATTFSGCLVW